LLAANLAMMAAATASVAAMLAESGGFSSSLSLASVPEAAPGVSSSYSD